MPFLLQSDVWNDDEKCTMYTEQSSPSCHFFFPHATHGKMDIGFSMQCVRCCWNVDLGIVISLGIDSGCGNSKMVSSAWYVSCRDCCPDVLMLHHCNMSKSTKLMIFDSVYVKKLSNHRSVSFKFRFTCSFSEMHWDILIFLGSKMGVSWLPDVLIIITDQSQCCEDQRDANTLSRKQIRIP